MRAASGCQTIVNASNGRAGSPGDDNCTVWVYSVESVESVMRERRCTFYM